MAVLSKPRVYTVGEITREVKSLLEEAYPNLWVEGEVSNLARPPSGHLYLTLKDEQAPLRAVIYRGVALRIRFDLRDGMRIVVRGRLSVYEPRGDYQFLVEEVQPKGIGPLELAFRQLKERLSLRGYFEPGRKRPLPVIPDRIGLISSPTGSAVRDVLEVLVRRWPAAEVLLAPVRVQGEGAAEDVAAALDILGKLPAPQRPDVVIIARGGGTLEDLWAFNEEVVAHAIFRSPIPVVTGIGHEDDLTIADLVADRRALTPTEAAERVAPDRAEVTRQLDDHFAHLRALMTRTLQLARARLEQLSARPCLRRPEEVVRAAGELVEALAARMQAATKTRVEGARGRLESAAGRLEALSPLSVLARGYSLTLADGQPLRDAADVRPGDRIMTRLSRGFVESVVERSDS
jgi:exodeoxyribonuclease VII large subunit